MNVKVTWFPKGSQKEQVFKAKTVTGYNLEKIESYIFTTTACK